MPRGGLQPQIDRYTLIQHAYATDKCLAVRLRTHELYSHPQFDFQEWVLDTLDWQGNEWVLDVGAGPGTYTARVRDRIPQGRYVAGDLSLGMARHAHEAGAAVINLDAQWLPFPAATFDVVLANHMLYHVPDVNRTLREFRRVLKPDGRLLAATNSVASMSEFDTLARRACTLLGYPKHHFTPVHQGFTLENGPRQMGRYFRAVARYDIPSAFRFPDVEPVITYLESTRPLREPQLPSGVQWEEFVNAIAKQVERLIRHYGELEVQKLAGVIVGTNGGGFAREYLRLLDTLSA